MERDVDMAAEMRRSARTMREAGFPDVADGNDAIAARLESDTAEIARLRARVEKLEEAHLVPDPHYLVWSCRIGVRRSDVPALPDGSDWPMRKAVQSAFASVTGVDRAFVFSGWNAALSDAERLFLAGDAATSAALDGKEAT